MSQRKKARKPLSKATAAPLAQLQRRRGVRNLAKRFLIVCEDDRSAPNYFHALKAHFNLSAASIEIAGSDGHTQPLQVVARAVEIKKQAARSDSGTEPFEEVWCVIDGDYGDKIGKARRKRRDNRVKLAISTVCFKYWVLLHFEENDKATPNCDGTVRALKKFIPRYEKGKCDFRSIVPRVREASARAETLRKPGIARGDLPEAQNPCSEVYLLVDAILDALS